MPTTTRGRSRTSPRRTSSHPPRACTWRYAVWFAWTMLWVIAAWLVALVVGAVGLMFVLQVAFGL